MKFVELDQDIRTKKDLASFLSEISEGAYFPYEFEDMIDILIDGMEQALIQGRAFRLGTTVTLTPEMQEGKWTSLGTTKEPWYVPQHNKIKVKLSPSFRKFLRKSSVEYYQSLNQKENSDDQ